MQVLFEKKIKKSEQAILAPNGDVSFEIVLVMSVFVIGYW